MAYLYMSLIGSRNVDYQEPQILKHESYFYQNFYSFVDDFCWKRRSFFDVVHRKGIEHWDLKREKAYLSVVGIS